MRGKNQKQSMSSYVEHEQKSVLDLCIRYHKKKERKKRKISPSHDAIWENECKKGYSSFLSLSFPFRERKNERVAERKGKGRDIKKKKDQIEKKRRIK